jgi:hypothetical protein
MYVQVNTQIHTYILTYIHARMQVMVLTPDVDRQKLNECIYIHTYHTYIHIRMQVMVLTPE